MRRTITLRIAGMRRQASIRGVGRTMPQATRNPTEKTIVSNTGIAHGILKTPRENDVEAGFLLDVYRVQNA
jgi:hypothetical protein